MWPLCHASALKEGTEESCGGSSYLDSVWDNIWDEYWRNEFKRIGVKQTWFKLQPCQPLALWLPNVYFPCKMYWFCLSHHYQVREHEVPGMKSAESEMNKMGSLDAIRGMCVGSLARMWAMGSSWTHTGDPASWQHSFFRWPPCP